MPTLNLNGIEVNFPFEPYECQVNYMKGVLNSIIQKKNAILESPTGTGKTLCLLCSSISWLLNAKADMQMAAVREELGDENSAQTATLFNSINKSNVLQNDQLRLPYPKIIYASRTHSQLTQVIKELKMTQYNNIKTCAIGSRDQLCINPQVNQQKNYTTKLNMCKAKVNSKTCYFYNNLENSLSELKTMLTVDIEDLVEFGNKHKCCPYYTARQLKDTADILFMPYNYLLDKKLRKSNNIEMTNAVVIFDEAHNVERVCEDSASAEITMTEIASAMNELQYLVEEIKNAPDEDSPFQYESGDSDYGSGGGLSGGNKFGFKGGAKNGDNDEAQGNMPATLEELKELLVILKAIEDELDALKVQGQEGLTKPASFLFELLDKCGVNFNKKGYLFDILQRLLQYFGAQLPNPRHHNGASLGKFNDFLQTVFSENIVGSDGGDKKLVNKIASYYKVHIKVDNVKGRILCYWCLSPGYSMQELLAEGARCIILTSGTLSPISTFKEDMKIPFDITLENPHIIKETQIKVLALSKGPDNIALSSKYTNRENDNYLQSLGQLVINFSKILPHGLLVFFPSYKALESATEFWRRNNQWKQIGDCKSIFVESKGAKECNETVVKYYEKIKDRNHNGAIMFAVCRGKISEGIDFADNNGRGVIITGLPFPLFTDARVILKRQYLDEKNSSGSLWYNQQAYRAVNQAIGRVIRHKNDYGAIILCDERFSQQSSISQLPGWMRAHVKKVTEYGVAISEMKKFFNIAVDKFPLANPKIPNINANSCLVKLDSNKNTANSGYDFMNNLCNSYKSSDCCAISSTSTEQNEDLTKDGLFNALNNVKPSTSSNNFEQLNSQSQSSYSSLASTDDGSSTDFKTLLMRRKNEEAKLNSGKCKVVVKDRMIVSEVKADSLNESKALLQKINNKLTKEEYQQFKVALSNFYAGKKSNDKEKKIKYYKVLRTLFAKDLEFFKEIEKFIQFTGVIKEQNQNVIENSTPNKRKFDECSK